MKKLFVFVLMIFVVLMMSGCGHNAVVASKGYGIDLSWTSDQIIPNVRLGYWDTVTVFVRENVKVKAGSTAGLKAQANGGSSQSANAVTGGDAGTTIEMETGPQTNGYVKDVLTSSNVGASNVEIAKQLYNLRNSENNKEEKK